MTSDSPFLIGGSEGSRSELETLLSMLRASRHFLLSAISDLSVGELDAQPSLVPNSIGSLVSHIIAAEAMFQNISFHGVRFQDYQGHLRSSFEFERNHLFGQELTYYQEALRSTREATLRLLAQVDDDWIRGAKTFMGKSSNWHYYWTHLMLDEARHTGQVTLIRKYLLPTSDPNFNPYAFPGS